MPSRMLTGGGIGRQAEIHKNFKLIHPAGMLIGGLSQIGDTSQIDGDVAIRYRYSAPAKKVRYWARAANSRGWNHGG